MKLTPRLVSPTNAVRLRRDLLAEKGNWLLVMPDDDIVVLTDDRVRVAYSVAVTKGSSHRKTREVRLPPKRVSVIVGGKTIRFGSQVARIAEALDRATSSGQWVTSSDLISFLTYDEDKKQTTARLSDMRKLNLCDVQDATSPFRWRINNNGKAVLQAISSEEESS